MNYINNSLVAHETAIEQGIYTCTTGMKSLTYAQTTNTTANTNAHVQAQIHTQARTHARTQTDTHSQTHYTSPTWWTKRLFELRIFIVEKINDQNSKVDISEMNRLIDGLVKSIELIVILGNAS